MSLETCQHLPDLTALDYVRLETCQHPLDLEALDFVRNGLCATFSKITTNSNRSPEKHRGCCQVLPVILSKTRH